MDHHYIYAKYLSAGTTGYAIINRFYHTYYDALSQSDYAHPEDLVNEIFLQLSKIDMARVRKEENYFHRAIKLQCWAILDRVLKIKKKVIPESQNSSNHDSNFDLDLSKSSDMGNPWQELEGQELMHLIRKFKKTLDKSDVTILNSLIDDPDETFVDLAKKKGINENTLRTKVRRLRQSLSKFLKQGGYSKK
jgi:hypothetical protein